MAQHERIIQNIDENIIINTVQQCQWPHHEHLFHTIKEPTWEKIKLHANYTNNIIHCKDFISLTYYYK